VDDRLAREKVGQALRDAIKTRRAAEKKQSSTDDATADMALSTGEMSLSQQLNAEKNKERAFDASLAEAKQLQQLQKDRHQLNHFATPPFFNSQLSADLEPTPIPQPYSQLPADASGRNNVHLRSELSASTLLRPYESGSSVTRAPNNTIFDSNRDFLVRRNLATELYAPRVTSGERHESSQPAYVQQLLPNVIESRRFSRVMTDAGVGAATANQQNLLLSMKNDYKLSAAPGNHKRTGNPPVP
jgi:hypothetical protein